MNKTAFLPIAVVALALSHLACIEAGKPKAAVKPPDAHADRVTLIGPLMREEFCIERGGREITKEDKFQDVLIAMDGTPEISANFHELTKELYGGNSINCEQAIAINEGFKNRLKYYIDGVPAAKGVEYSWSIKSVTGSLSEKDGKKWITITDPKKDIAGVKYSYPKEWLIPDKPFKKAGETPLMIQVTDTLSMKCILLPAGKFLFRKAVYIQPIWRDECPYEVTLTKPFWLAETLVTQEQWDAFMGADQDYSTLKDPKRPVRNMWAVEANKFCQILSERNHRKIRLPGEAELQYAMRVGTSNPMLGDKYKAEFCDDPKVKGGLLPVKSKAPNAWGLYDMESNTGYTLTRDDIWKVLGSPEDKDKSLIDPYFSPEAAEAAGKTIGHMGVNNVTYHESTGAHDVKKGPADRKADTAYASDTLRILVEATPEEIAKMEKAAGK